MRALVIGLGKSGRGAAKLLLQQGAEVVAVDRLGKEMEGVLVLPEGAEVGPVDLVVVSPGVPPDHPLARGKVIGEAELAFRTLKNRAIGITGTNGKTTLTLLVTHILNYVGIKSRALGNVGASLAEYACDSDPEEFLVVELSSFQLETMTTPALDLGIITNITPDHLDRYPSFEAYAKTKWRLKNLIKEGGVFIPHEGEDSYLQLTEDERYWKIIGRAIVKAAWALCRRLKISWEDFNSALKTFKKPPHRMEWVKEINGVSFVNDSKGTNPEAVVFAVESIEGPILLIAGGRSKKGTFESFKKAFPGKVKTLFVIGETAPQMINELASVIPTKRCKNLQEAVAKARQVALKGDTVLLSPGCASFDQFQSYEERGEKFKESIERG